MLKINTHAHNLGQSPCSDVTPEDVVDVYKKVGYDGIFLTNHLMEYYIKNNYPHTSPSDKVEYFLEGYFRAKKRGDEIGLRVYLGMELNLALYNREGENFPLYEFLLFGLSEDFVRRNPLMYTWTQEKCFEECNKNDMLMVQTHPFRERNRLADVNFMHGIEVFNGHPYQDSHNDLALEVAEKFSLIQTAGDDYHNANFENRAGILVNDSAITMQDIVRELRERKTKVFHINENTLIK